ncbi:hypothetical protein M408DRAFT_166744 [Serendipita vermifera MAFF 305830]|uniref:Uncharacterized protein n=1 Tax=Serendipita vermifera MAFF 305830 TaxID=933852 RepID=A0A0C2WMR3_SERVB|nr:hypothetical protein M408DRAFT_166744 [Serendipita vermifera MAFF 305830]
MHTKNRNRATLRSSQICKIKQSMKLVSISSPSRRVMMLMNDEKLSGKEFRLLGVRS